MKNLIIFFKTKEKVAYLLNSVVLILIGIVSFLYSMFYRSFAELHIKLPFLNFPIFVGEILLGICLILLIMKVIMLHKSLGAWYYLLLFYLSFVLFRAFLGYSQWGALSLRHAAMFYYPLFAVITYNVYDPRFFNKYTKLFLIIFFLIVLKGTDFVNYFLFTYVILTAILALKFPQGYIKYASLIALTLLAPIMDFFHCARGKLIANIAGFFVLISGGFILLNIEKKYKVMAASTCLVILTLSAVTFGSRNEVGSLISFSSINAFYKEYDCRIKAKKRRYLMQVSSPSLYRASNSDFDRIFEKGLDGKRSLAVVKLSQSPQAQEEILFVEKYSSPKVVLVADAEEPTKDISFNKPAAKSVTVKQQKKAMPSSRSAEEVKQARAASVNYGTMIFRLLIWRDMLRELWESRAVFGFNFGKPLRSESIEITGLAYKTWAKNGWVFPHNTYFNILYRSGVIGILLLVSLLVVVYRMSIIALINRSLIGIMLISIIVYWFVIGATFVLFELPYHAIPFWSLFGLSFAYIKGLNRKGIISHAR